MTGKDRGYALDLWSPVQHVASELERVAPEALSVDELAASYRHVVISDLSRVRGHEGLGSDAEATRWLITEALSAIERRGKGGQVQVVTENGGYRLANGVGFDDIRFDKRKLRRTDDDIYARFRDPFNPMSGEFSENVRRISGKDSMAELRESMRTFGWVKEFPALTDERGVVLVGHRRLAIAEELGIDPIIRTLTLGKGDAADAERFKLAIVSNLGSKPFTKEERARLSAYLYGERGWTMEKIAEALNVSSSTTANDLFPATGKRDPRGRPRKLTPEQAAEAAHRVLDEGEPMDSVQSDLVGTKGHSAVQDAVNQERGRREKEAELAQTASQARCTCPNCGDIHTAQ